MRRLKTLHHDAKARRAVGAARAQARGGDEMDFGLLCYERGRHSTLRAAVHALTASMLAGDPDGFGRRFLRELSRGTA